MLRTSASNGRRRAHASVPRSRRLVADEKASDQAIVVEGPDVDDLRRVRAEFYNRSPNDRERHDQKDMEIHASRRRSRRTTSAIRGVDVVAIREERRKHDPERRHHRKKLREEYGSDDVYVYRTLDENPGGKTPERHHQARRRSTVSMIPDKNEIQKIQISSTGPPRRDTERKTSHPRDPSRSSNSERPVNSEATSRVIRSKPPVSRYFSLCTTRVQPNADILHSGALLCVCLALSGQHAPWREVRQLSEGRGVLLCLPWKKSWRESHQLIKRMNGHLAFLEPSSACPSFQNLYLRNSKPLLISHRGIADTVYRVECLTCLSSDVPISKSAKLACGHRMCHSCLRRIFALSVTDPQHMPPKCCTQDHIPLKHVDKLFDVRFKMKWNQKYQEYTTKNRIYCPAKGCGEWIKPSHIHTDTHSTRKYGKCNRCRTKVCVTCNGKWHTSRDCPKDDATQRFAEMAKEKGWQRCYNCSAMVELKEGCNHMTCRCRAEFCMTCGLKWKSCNCPWFNYDTVERDRPNHMNIPQPMGMNPVINYQEEMDRRLEQERRDEDLARRMQGIGINFNQPAYFHQPHPAFLPQPAYQNFIQRTADVISAPYPPVFGVTPPPNPEPIAVPMPQPWPRRHSVAARGYATPDLYTMREPAVRERVIPRHTFSDYAREAARRRASAAADEEDEEEEDRTAIEETRRETVGRRISRLAGLSSNSVEGRVDQWRRHVGDD